MIVDLFLSLFLGILTTILGVLPQYDAWTPEYDDGRYQYIADLVRDSLTFLDLFVPVNVIAIVLLGILGARVFVGFWAFINWIWRSLPGKGT